MTEKAPEPYPADLDDDTSNDVDDTPTQGDSDLTPAEAYENSADESPDVPAAGESDDPYLETFAPVNEAFDQDIKDRYEEAKAVADKSPEEPHEVDTDFTILTHMDPARQMDPNGIYLDDIERRKAELVRARIEGRSPDLEHPGTTAGDVLQSTVTAGQYVDKNAAVPVYTTLPVVHGVPKVDN